jgi:hypothetical protein
MAATAAPWMAVLLGRDDQRVQAELSLCGKLTLLENADVRRSSSEKRQSE